MWKRVEISNQKRFAKRTSARKTTFLQMIFRKGETRGRNEEENIEKGGRRKGGDTRGSHLRRPPQTRVCNLQQFASRFELEEKLRSPRGDDALERARALQ